MNLITLAAAAKQLGLAASTLRHQIRNRKIAAVKVGRGWYVKVEEVERYRAQVQR